MDKKIKIEDIICTDPDILGGTPVFKGTRVPVQSLFWHIEQGIPVEEFLEDFPTVSREQVIALLELTGTLFDREHIQRLYEASA